MEVKSVEPGWHIPLSIIVTSPTAVQRRER